MSDANRTAVSITEESELGVIPANPVFEAQRVTGANLSYAPQTVTSNELRADRQITDLIRTGFEAGGDLPFEQSYGAQDTLMQGVLMSTWVNKAVRTGPAEITAVANGTITVSNGARGFFPGAIVRGSGFANAANNARLVAAVDATGSSITNGTIVAEDVSARPNVRLKLVGFQSVAGASALVIAGTAGTLTNAGTDFTLMGLRVGEWVRLGGVAGGTYFGGSAVAAGNGWYRLSGITATVLSFDVVPPNAATDAGAGKTVQMFFGDSMRNGTTRRSYAVELQYQDLATPEFELYRGMVPASYSLTLGSKAIVTGSIGFMGMDAVNSTARTGGASDKPAPTNDVMNTSSNVGTFGENGQPIAGGNYVTASSISISNGIRRKSGIGALGDVDLGTGRFAVTGTLSMYYGSNAILNKVRNNTASSYDVRFIDGPRALHFDIPRIKYNTGSPTTPGIDTERMLEGNFTGMMHPTLGYTMQVQRFEETY